MELSNNSSIGFHSKLITNHNSFHQTVSRSFLFVCGDRFKMLMQYENQNKKQFDSIFFSPARVKKIIEVIISVLSFIFKSHMVLQNQNTIHKFYSNTLFYMYVCLHNGQFLIPLDISHKHLTEKKKMLCCTKLGAENFVLR